MKLWICEVTSTSEAMFEYLAELHPEQLITLLRSSRLSSADLTLAAEIAGRIPDSKIVRTGLLPLLDHVNPVVREGAIYGLANHLDEPTRQRLRRLVNEDTSRAVRTAASDALEVYGGGEATVTEVAALCGLPKETP